MAADHAKPSTSRRRRPSLRDVGKLVGVSHTAVAMALRDDPRLSEDLRKRIREVARREGYVVSDIVQSMVSGWSGTVGVVIPSLHSSFIAEMVHAVTESLWEHMAIPMVLCSGLDIGSEERMLGAMARKRVGGIIIMPVPGKRAKDSCLALLKEHTPIVAIDSPLPDIDAPLVASDDELGAMEVTRHLLGGGHRRILYVTPHVPGTRTQLPRERGYRRAMREAGIQPRVLHVRGPRISMDETLTRLDDHFSTPAGRRTTAVFAFNDGVAHYTYAFARRKALVVGRDLAVAGYGNMQSSANAVFKPTLTTVEQYPALMGKAAVDILRGLVTGRQPLPTTFIKPQLVIRDSTSLTRPK